MKRYLAGVLLALSTTAALADPTGSWKVSGKGPDGAAYAGTATIAKTGDTYRIVWKLGGDPITGTGVGDDRFFAVGYGSGPDEGGVAVYARDGDGWKGIWTYYGGKKVGIERLSPK